MGQEKPCVVYRFIALGSIEEQVYRRQVTKLSISKRVIDQQQIDNHYEQQDLSQYYNIDNINPQDDVQEIFQHNVPQDQVLIKLCEKYSYLIHSYHIHDSLFENKSEEGLTEVQMDIAWREFDYDVAKKTRKETTLKYRQLFESGMFYSILMNSKEFQK